MGRGDHRGTGNDISGFEATVPEAAAGSALGERHCSTVNGSSVKLWEGAGGWSILEGD